MERDPGTASVRIFLYQCPRLPWFFFVVGENRTAADLFGYICCHGSTTRTQSLSFGVLFGSYGSITPRFTFLLSETNDFDFDTYRDISSITTRGTSIMIPLSRALHRATSRVSIPRVLFGSAWILNSMERRDGGEVVGVIFLQLFLPASLIR